MQVLADGDGSMLTLRLHTTHVERADQDVAATLDAIRRLWRRPFSSRTVASASATT
jgi:hypothetical protein